ncbi:acyltransferase family protein [Caballeronia sp. DA-9]|uniref:acyltransferase family protein n=1 Tax=Caballeronia sp. DA-9 TaxID=3436237 RepID=UPI003F67AC73
MQFSLLKCARHHAAGPFRRMVPGPVSLTICRAFFSFSNAIFGQKMGIYRLLLAVAVLLSHLHVRVLGGNIGVFAVISFFLLSGYVMTALIDRHYSSVSRVGTFYLDRAMRLFPQFLFYIVLTLMLVAIAHPVSPFLSDLTAGKALLNAVMLPLNFYDHFPGALVIPQSWSLGLEAQFYIVIPLIVVGRVRAAAFVASALFFLLPYLAVVDPDLWGYRMLPGTLFMFLFGSFLYRRSSTHAVIAAYVLVWILFAGTLLISSINRPYNREVLAGLSFGVPAVWLLSKAKFGWIEELAGDLSYGVFLNHFLLIWMLQAIGVDSMAPWYAPTLIACSLGLSTISYIIIERPVIALRRAIRNRSNTLSRA